MGGRETCEAKVLLHRIIHLELFHFQWKSFQIQIHIHIQFQIGDPNRSTGTPSGLFPLFSRQASVEFSGPKGSRPSPSGKHPRPERENRRFPNPIGKGGKRKRRWRDVLCNNSRAPKTCPRASSTNITPRGRSSGTADHTCPLALHPSSFTRYPRPALSLPVMMGIMDMDMALWETSTLLNRTAE